VTLAETTGVIELEAGDSAGRGPRSDLGVRAEVIDGPDRALVRESIGAVVVGTSSENEMVLTDPTVSRYHVELRCEDGVLVRDLGSRNGTFVNGVRIQTAVVPYGACLRLGASIVRLMPAGESKPAPAPPMLEIPGVVAWSPPMQEVARSVNRAAQSNVSVLLQGETGTGKGIIARAIHDASARASRPFVVVDSGALPATLIASQLFGHERGAFTGADRRQEGAFELAQGGTIFLDEIGELPLSIQPALLGVLERRSFRRLGSKDDTRVDVRVISSTHRDLRAEANQGTFRGDLYFRLAATRICIPPLRERRDDIEPLVALFARAVTGIPGLAFSQITMESLNSHRWPGNVRELRNVVEGALALGSMSLNGGQAQPALLRSPGVVPYRQARAEVISAFERSYLGRLLELTEGNVAAGARAAHMDRPYLRTLLMKHGLR
jgi:DNA-binding NtrC family response regulator